MPKEILKDEMLSDEELDAVTGGTAEETDYDGKFLREIGVLKEDLTGSNEAKERQAKVAWAQMGLVLVPGRTNDAPNEYYNAKGQQITRADAFAFAAKKMRVKFDVSDYLGV